MGATDAVDDRIAHIDVACRHIDFQAQGFAAVGKLAVFHACEQVEVFFDAAVAVRAVFYLLRSACRGIRAFLQGSNHRHTLCRL